MIEVIEDDEVPALRVDHLDDVDPLDHPGATIFTAPGTHLHSSGADIA